jgi:hypothetical protein
LNDAVIVPGFIGDSSRLCHYWNYRFPFGLLAILLAIQNRQNIGGKIRDAAYYSAVGSWRYRHRIGELFGRRLLPNVAKMPNFAIESSSTP